MMSLRIQLHLLNCLEAFKVIGQTWDLAGRCWRVLDCPTCAEGMKPGTGSGIYIREAEEERGSFVWFRSRGEFTNDYGDFHSIPPPRNT